jgi:hypothetical protein
LNECLASIQVKNNVKLNRFNILLLLFIQGVVIFFALGIGDNSILSRVNTLISISYTVSIYLSYKVASNYYRIITDGNLKIHESILIGLLPGSTSLLIYLLYGVFVTSITGYWKCILVVSILFPSMIQYWYINIISSQERRCIKREVLNISSFSTIKLLGVILYISLLTIMANYLRRKVSLESSTYSALILVAINSVTSLFMVMQRAAHLEDRLIGLNKLYIMISTLITAFVLALAMSINNKLLFLIGIFIIQMYVVLSLNYYRKNMIAIKV